MPMLQVLRRGPLLGASRNRCCRTIGQHCARPAASSFDVGALRHRQTGTSEWRCPMGAILCSGGGRGGPWNFNSAMYQQFRKAATASQQAPPAAAASSSSNGGSRLRWGLLVVVKSLTLWAPAILFWVQVVLGEPLLDRGLMRRSKRRKTR